MPGERFLVVRRTLGTIATKTGVSASAVYASIRKINRPDGGYTDTAVSQILVLAEELGMDLDAAVMGTPAPQRTSMSEELSSILPLLTREPKESLWLKVIENQYSLKHQSRLFRRLYLSCVSWLLYAKNHIYRSVIGYTLYGVGT